MKQAACGNTTLAEKKPIRKFEEKPQATSGLAYAKPPQCLPQNAEKKTKCGKTTFAERKQRKNEEPKRKSSYVPSNA
jgi:hypothetical protein